MTAYLRNLQRGFIIFKVAHLRWYPSDTGRRYAQSGDSIDVLVAGSSLEVATQGSRDNAGALIGASPQWAESHPRSQPSSSGPSLDNSHVLPASSCCRVGVRDKHGDRRDRRGRLLGCRRHRVAGSRPTASGRPPANHPLRAVPSGMPAANPVRPKSACHGSIGQMPYEKHRCWLSERRGGETVFAQTIRLDPGLLCGFSPRAQRDVALAEKLACANRSHCFAKMEALRLCRGIR